ncbi:hypothetical protein [Candidatus Pantoea floridensis]|uniref:Uncharacterized protein n=1 Tax=Candidatus Pantoea floridensis TaxID=1938870 RepID=A0A286BXC4_9GAMM|nr:hypothetical protein [Pantoea floridensis]PIF21293.1 hypothetical protein BX596_0685 [Enterobacteriaceae bacterium JKS000233]SOD38805.1 hypothetical protein SAMN06273570_3238 [Pantoea floridensis]
MNTKQLLKDTSAALTEAEYEISRWCSILRATDISDVPMLNVCREALAMWDKKHNELLSNISYLTTSTKINLH